MKGESKYGVPRLLPNGELNLEWVRRQYAARKDKMHAYSAMWRAANPEKIKMYAKRYFDKNKDLLHEKGREYSRKYRLSHRKEHLNAMRRFHLKRGYGMTLEEYQARLKNQENRCVICGTKHLEISRKRLQVDHDHKTGKIRALLCHNCNAILGHANDNPIVLRKAAKYIEHHMD